ncbi:MAG: serine/threonine-protein kinase, partial [Chloroflexota bacterium]|nr:serine/threonine-protein kinase [Chloroflexota bacterium]
MNLKEIGGYQVIEMVGEGGQGAVYRAQDPSSGQIVAIKVLARSASDGEFLDRFQREASIMATLRHPNVVEVYDHGEEGGQHYIVTEFVTENLERILERGGTLPLQRAITVVQQIASALQVSHNAGITHRDIKPANVLLNDAGEVKLTDFGIASAETLDSMTSENTTVGTPLYMSPEQIQGSDAIDGRSDLYSLGCLLYEVLTGSTPFQGKSTFEIFNGHINESHDPIANHMDEFPEQLEELLVKSLTKDREQRYQTADEMINDLQVISTILAEGPQDVARTRVMPKVLATQVLDKPNTTGSSTTGGGMPKWLMPAGAIVALLVIIGGAGFFFMGQDTGAVGLATGIAAGEITDENWAPGVISNPEGIGQAVVDLSSAYVANPVNAVTGINQLDDLDPMIAASVIIGMHDQNQTQAAQFLLSIGDADELRLEGYLARITEMDAVQAGDIFVSLINENVVDVAAFIEDANQGANGQILQAMYVEAAKSDELVVTQLVNQAALTPGAIETTADVLLSIARADIDIVAEILGTTSIDSAPIWQLFVSIDPTAAGVSFVKAHKNGYETSITGKIIQLLADQYSAGLLISHMAREDSTEAAAAFLGVIGNPDVEIATLGEAIIEAAKFDHVAVENMLIVNSDFIDHVSPYVHPQIWTVLELPMAGDGEDGKGIWSKPSLEATSLIDFSSVVVKSLDGSAIDSATINIFDVTPPVSDTRADRNVLTHVQVDAEGFTDSELTSILVFDIPEPHFTIDESGLSQGHPWSVELSRFNENSQTWTPVFANTLGGGEETITFAAPVAGLSQYGTSFWSVSTSSSSVAGSQLSIDQIDTSPAGNGQVHVQATVTNRSPQAVIRDISLFIDGVPEYSTTVEVDSQSVVLVETDIFMEPGMRDLALGNHVASYENLLVAGSTTPSGSSNQGNTSIAGEEVVCASGDSEQDKDLFSGAEGKGAIDCSGDKDEWTFDGKTGEFVSIEMFADSFTDLDPYIQLINPLGKTETFDDDSAGDLNSGILGWELRET